ncbi:B2 protein-like [Zophobas morio]|uniref:B2 protein-like n=1 Tax=Zophobas morio TaxID=2755281 RepID=UPI003082EFF9
MKLPFVILLLSTCVLAALSPEQIAKLEPISKECRTESGMTAEEITKFRNTPQFEDSPKLRKHALCLYKKTGLISESGDMESEVVKSRLQAAGASAETIAKILNCAKKDTPEETAFELAKCIFKDVPNFSPVE